MIIVIVSGTTRESRGTAYVIFEDVFDAKAAVEHLSGFNIQNRYLIVLYHSQNKQNKTAMNRINNANSSNSSIEKREQQLRDLQAKHGIDRDEL